MQEPVVRSRDDRSREQNLVLRQMPKYFIHSELRKRQDAALVETADCQHSSDLYKMTRFIKRTALYQQSAFETFNIGLSGNSSSRWRFAGAM